MTQRATSDLDAIVLAAGRGVRFGGGKLTASLDDAPLVAGSLLTAFLSPVRQVFVAVGPDPGVLEAVRATATRLAVNDRLVVVPISDPSTGMGASLTAAARAVPDDTGGVFIFLGDMPRIDPATPAHLARMLFDPNDIVAPTHLGRRGHPVLFGATWLPALRAQSGDEGARGIVDSAGQRLIRVPVEDPGIHIDVDRPSDLASIATRR